MLAFRGKRDRKSEGTTPQYFASVVYMQIFGQNSCLCLAESKFKVWFCSVPLEVKVMVCVTGGWCWSYERLE